MPFPRIAVAVAAFLVALAGAFAAWAWAGRPQAVIDAPAPRFSCLSYAPFSGDQTPFDLDLVIPREQIVRDLTLLAERTRCVRTYDIKFGLAEVLPVARDLGLKVMQGIWIGAEAEKNERDLADAVALVRRHHETVEAVIVGNEVLLRREQPPEAMIGLIERVRAAVPPEIPVTYADVWEFWLENPEVARAVDFVTVHTLPYWEDHPIGIGGAVPHVQAIVREMQAAFPGKPIFIGEAGWPSAGRMREGALPSPTNQARFVRGLMAAMAESGVGLNLIEAFDQPWKRASEGTVGGHWGVYDDARNPKFPLTGPVRDVPDWRRRFVVGAALGGAMASLALLAAGRRRRSAAEWFALAVGTQAAGALLVAGGASAIDASNTVADALSWGGRWLLAAAAALFVALALSKDAPGATPIAALLAAARARVRPDGGLLAVALGLTRAGALLAAAITAACFLVDARYRDFPVALSLAPGAALLALAIQARRSRSAASSDLREERLLATAAAAGAFAVALSEAPYNFQAWGLLIAYGALAAAAWVEPGSAAGERAARNAAISAPAADGPAL